MILPDRALIVRRPWCDLILSGLKPWEMRSALTRIRGRIGIIQAGSGCVIGEVELLDCLPALSAEEAAQCLAMHRVEDAALLSRWPVPWVMTRPHRYRQPIPYKHPPGAVTWVKL